MKRLVVLGLLFGCSNEIDLATKTRDVQDNVTLQDAVDYAGGTIKVQNAGVSVSVDGGVKIVTSSTATRISATARLVALVLPNEKSNGDLSLNDVQATFTLTRSGNDVIVSCGHGQTHGSSTGSDSGCELVTVTVPQGTAAAPLDLTVTSGSGELTLDLDAAVLKNLVASAEIGDTTATLPATPGATIAITGEQAGNLDVTMPAAWSADVVTLAADSVTNTFPLNAAGGYGATGGIASLVLTSRAFAGATGKIALH